MNEMSVIICYQPISLPIQCHQQAFIILGHRISPQCDQLPILNVSNILDLGQLKAGDIREDADLLNGPQLETDANSQDNIDALMASFD